MTEQRRRGRSPDEMRERAVRMVFEPQPLLLNCLLVTVYITAATLGTRPFNVG